MTNKYAILEQNLLFMCSDDIWYYACLTFGGCVVSAMHSWPFAQTLIFLDSNIK